MNSKICTSIEQSEKLIELGIDVNTADMIYQSVEDEYGDGEWESIPRNNSLNIGYDDDISAWSLSALLDVLPRETRLLKSATDDIFYHTDCPKGNVDEWFDNPVDACVAMIEKLHELKML